MADEVDTTNDMVLLNTEYLIRNATAAKPEAMATGVCLTEFCGEPLPKGHRWCNSDCRDMWVADKKRGYHEG